MKLNMANEKKSIIGGKLVSIKIKEDSTNSRFEEEVEKYFRPSKLPVINTKAFHYEFYEDIAKTNVLPDYLFKNPEDTIINYFSILREASNYEEGKKAGCGSIGDTRAPYPIAYKFLTESYQNRVKYTKYLQSFKNILHINLLKLKRVESDKDHLEAIKYFVEFETIEGSEKDATYFAYYYGYLYLTMIDEKYLIDDMIFYGENYLCAPYHGWSHIGESVVDIEYGYWCNLVQKRMPSEEEGYIKKVPFNGTDGNVYMIKFIRLTNDTDFKIGEYEKVENGMWEPIIINPEECLKKKELKDNK